VRLPAERRGWLNTRISLAGKAIRVGMDVIPGRGRQRLLRLRVDLAKDDIGMGWRWPPRRSGRGAARPAPRGPEIYEHDVISEHGCSKDVACQGFGCHMFLSAILIDTCWG